jgi:hypothetical protein
MAIRVVKSSWPNVTDTDDADSAMMFREPGTRSCCALFVQHTMHLRRPRGFSESPNLQHIGTMYAQQFLPEVPNNVKFRVLIIGRANSGKTSILQRVCDTTESPEIYRLGPQGKRERVRSHP